MEPASENPATENLDGRGMIAFIALPQAIPPQAEEIEVVLRERFEDVISFPSEVDMVGGCTAVIGETRFRVAGHGAAIPSELLEQTCRTAWYWPEAASVLQRHHSHVIVVVEPGPESAIQRCMLLTRLVADLGARFDYLGVYWDNAPMVHSAEAFAQVSERMTARNLPLNLWVDFRLIPERDGSFSLATFGLEALGHMEVEIRESRVDPEKHLWWAFNTAHYVLNGAEIDHEETIGRTDDEKILVLHEPSMFDESRTVLRLDLQSSGSD